MPDLETAIKKLEELEAEATMSPWRQHTDLGEPWQRHIYVGSSGASITCPTGFKYRDDITFVTVIRNTHPATLALLRAMKAEILKHRSDWDGTHGMLPPWWLATDAAERDFVAAVGGGE